MIWLLLACAPVPDRRDLLPAAVAVSVQGVDGHRFSAVVQLDDPERPPRLHYLDRMQRVDGGALGEPLPAGEVLAQGPGHGFGVRLEGEQVLLRLPLREQPLVLAREVQVLYSVEMLTYTQAHSGGLQDFGVVSTVLLAQGQAQVDGDLEEWRGARSLAVDSAGHLRSGAQHWSGPRDAALAVVGRVDGERVVLAIRVRDDSLLLGQDTILVQGPGVELSLPAQGPGSIIPAPGWQASFTEAVEFGFGVELSAPLARFEGGLDSLVVGYRDQDADGGSSVLASAPSPQALLDVPAAGPPPRVVR